MTSPMDDEDLPGISLEPGRELSFADLQFGADLIKTVCAIEIFRQRPIIDLVFIIIEHSRRDAARPKTAATPTL